MSDVNIAFQQAAHNILLENEALLQHFTLELKSHDAGWCWNSI